MVRSGDRRPSVVARRRRGGGRARRPGRCRRCSATSRGPVGRVRRTAAREPATAPAERGAAHRDPAEQHGDRPEQRGGQQQQRRAGAAAGARPAARRGPTRRRPRSRPDRRSPRRAGRARRRRTPRGRTRPGSCCWRASSCSARPPRRRRRRWHRPRRYPGAGASAAPSKRPLAVRSSGTSTDWPSGPLTWAVAVAPSGKASSSSTAHPDPAVADRRLHRAGVVARRQGVLDDPAPEVDEAVPRRPAGRPVRDVARPARHPPEARPATSPAAGSRSGPIRSSVVACPLAVVAT